MAKKTVWNQEEGAQRGTQGDEHREGDAQTLAHVIIRQPAPVSPEAQALLTKANSIVIATPDDYVVVTDVLRSITLRLDKNENDRIELKAPSLEAGRRVDAFFKPALDALAKARDVVRAKLKAYDDEQRRIAAKRQQEADEAARVERQRLEEEQRKERELARIAMQEIKGIQQQPIIAQMGRQGVRIGGTLECIRQTLTETEAWQINPEAFGAFTEAAQNAKDSAIAAIKAMESTFIANAERQRVEREKAAAMASGDKARAEKAEAEAAEARKQQIVARAAQMEAEERAVESDRAAKVAAAASNLQLADLQRQSAGVVAQTVVSGMVEVEGLARVKTYKWRLVDKTKVKDDFKILDEKAINALVRSSKMRAEEMVGGIEVYEDSTFRQERT